MAEKKTVRVIYRTRAGLVQQVNDISQWGSRQGLLKLGVSEALLNQARVGWTLLPLAGSIEKSAETLKSLLIRAARLNDYRRKEDYFYSYFTVHIPENMSEDLVQMLKTSEQVEAAYLDPDSLEPAKVDPSDDPDFGQQGYLGPKGINIMDAWPQMKRGVPVGFPGADGEGIQLIDVERGWDVNGDFGANVVFNPPIIGQISPTSIVQQHGMQVLMITSAADNQKLGIGIAPTAQARTASYLIQDGNEVVQNRAAAINKAISVMSPGDVLLLEMQLNISQNPPVEELELEFEAIKLAVNSDITVIEPAGNGATKLDDRKAMRGNSTALQSIFDGSPAMDSGAIVVAAAKHRTLAIHDDSNFGQRVDCFAWGTGVFSQLEKTSAASAIVAGAAVSVQGAAKKKLGMHLKPKDLRQRFKDPANNTPGSGRKAGQMGLMPNVKNILNHL